jgi:SpoVK/Ycf46/Vps4 family AAA+-type ATPase
MQKTKYGLLGQQRVLSFEYETANFDQVGGLNNLKQWLSLRKAAFLTGSQQTNLDKPKGILLVDIQGGGKSLAGLRLREIARARCAAMSPWSTFLD